MKKNELTKEEVKYLAYLARLFLIDDEIDQLRKKLTETIDYIRNLDELNTDKVLPSSQTIDIVNVFFEDGEKNNRQLTIDQALKNTKNKKNNYFVVKKIL